MFTVASCFTLYIDTDPELAVLGSRHCFFFLCMLQEKDTATWNFNYALMHLL